MWSRIMYSPGGGNRWACGNGEWWLAGSHWSHPQKNLLYCRLFHHESQMKSPWLIRRHRVQKPFEPRKCTRMHRHNLAYNNGEGESKIEQGHYLLTYSMVQSPSWEANWFAASQQIPRTSRNPKVHYRTHKRPPPVTILGQPNPVHTHTSHLLEIHSNIIQPSTLRFSQWSLSLRFPQQDLIHPSLLTHTRHMPSPSHSSRFYHPHNIGWGVQISMGIRNLFTGEVREERKTG